MELGHFALLEFGSIFIGIAMSYSQNYRFGVIRCVPESQQPVAISWVLAGGVAGAVIGPEFSKHTIDLLPTRYSGIFLIGSCINGLHCVLLMLCTPMLKGLRDTTPAPAMASVAASDGSTKESDPPPAPEAPRTLRVAFARPRCLACPVVASLAYGVMIFLMSALPLAMTDSGIDFPTTAAAVQIHMVCMFAPSFLTGHAVKKLGAPTMKVLGALVLAAGGATMYFWTEVPNAGSGYYGGQAIAAAIAAQASGSWSTSSIVAPGGHVVAFTLSQAIVGVGWNWCFVAATSGLAKLTRPRERPKVQAANDVFIFTISGLLGILAAVVYRAVGWRAMQLAAFIAGGAILVVVSISEGLERREPARSSAEQADAV